MGLIPAQTLDAIRTKLDIVELVSEYVPQLQRAGRNMKGRCPFHQERTPSFIVSPERQTYHCFGCGEGGDIFAFVMKIESLNFSEAAERLAGKAGVKIEVEEDVSPEARQRLKLKELLEFAAVYYHGLLLESPQAEPARRYLASRRVSAQSVGQFKLGFAPRSSGLLDACAKKGWSKELLVSAGLASRQSGREYFFDRLLFPIFDAKGAVVAFGGRTLGDGEPKYLNSPESPLFSKSRVLYGLSHGAPAIRKARRALLMEGYMDVIASHQHGLTTAVAPLGTALTAEHAGLLGRYASEVLIVFDADNAGINAAVRGAEVALAKGLGVRIASVPEGKDPDEHLHAKGVASFEAALSKAVDLVEYKTEMLIGREKAPLSPEAKSGVAKQVLTTIEQSPDEVLKSEWIRRLAQRLGVPEQALRAAAATKAPVRVQAAPAPSAAALDDQDQELLLHMLKQPSLCALSLEEDFVSEPARKIWSALRRAEPWPADWSAKLVDSLSGGERLAAQRMLVKVDEIGRDDAEASVKRALASRRRKKRYEELRVILRDAKPADAAVAAEFMKLSAELKGSAGRA